MPKNFSLRRANLYIIILVYCAKRFFRPCCTSKPDVRPPRKIIDFCRKDLRGARVLLSTETLTLWFSRFQNRIARNEVKEWYRPVQGPFSDPNLATFFEMFTKRWTLIDPPIPVGYGAFWMLSSIWRNLTCDHCCFEHLVQSAHGWKECFAPLPCTVYLVKHSVKSIFCSKVGSSTFDYATRSKWGVD